MCGRYVAPDIRAIEREWEILHRSGGGDGWEEGLFNAAHSQFINTVLDQPGPWLVLTGSGAFKMCLSGLSALRFAYERLGQAQSLSDAPKSLRRLGTDDRLGAEEILVEWHNLGWPLPG
jgi:hypothetical protein